MEGGTVNKVAKDLERYKQNYEVESTFKVEPVSAAEKKGVDHSTENPNETPKNIHPTLGHNIDVKA